MNLDEAIDTLEAIKAGENLVARHFPNASTAASTAARNVTALDLAIDALRVKATVAPARKTDPSTSRRAAPTEFKAGSQREKILMAFYDYGLSSARTACEKAGLDLGKGSPWKRVSELKAAGHIAPVATAGGKRELYLLTVKGRAIAHEIAGRRAS